MDIGRTPQTTYVLPAILLVRLVRVEPTLNALPVMQGIFYSLHLQQQRVLILVRLGIGKSPHQVVARLATLVVRFVLVQVISYALPAIQDIFYSLHLQQHACSTPVQLDIGRTPQITFARLVILLVLTVRAQAILNVPFANQGISCNHRVQHALILVQMGIGRIQRVALMSACPAMPLVRCVSIQVIPNALLASQDIFSNQVQQLA